METSGSTSRLLSCIAVVAVSCGLRAELRAQRGAAPHAGPAISAPHSGGFAPASRGGSTGPAASRAPAPATRGVGYGTGQSLFPSPGITSTRPVYYSNGIARYGNPNHSSPRYGYNGGSIGVLSLGYPGYLDGGYDPDFLNPTYNPNTVGEGSGLLPDAVINPQPPVVNNYGGYPDSGYSSYPAPPYPQSGYAKPAEQASAAEPEQAPVATPFLAPPTRRAAAPKPAPLPEEDAVTIVFKDGRPNEQIRNYALTRTALYVTAGKVRTIPVDDIDLTATERANAKSGVDFQLPTK